MSGFDPELFLNTQVNQASETRMVPIPVGEYQAIIDKIDPRNPKEGLYFLDVTWQIIDGQIDESLGFKEPKVRQSCYMEIDESGGLKFGTNTNVQLGKIREAVGQNADGMPWSPMNLVGAGPALVAIEHRADPTDASIIYSEVKRVAPVR